MEREELFNASIEMAYKHLSANFPRYASDEDAKQEVLVSLWKATDEYTDDGRADFQSYAQRCITNHILNWIKSNTPTIKVKTSREETPYERIPVKFKSMQEQSDDSKTEFQDTLEDENHFEDTVLFEHDLNRILSEMNNDYDKTIASMLKDGMSKQEIINATGLERHTVDYSCKRIAAALLEYEREM